MIDLHTHTLLSDGALLPSELVRRAEVKGYRAIALTDHVDAANIEEVVAQTVRVCRRINSGRRKIIVIPGVEITHVAPAEIRGLVAYARSRGIRLVVVHGETPVEPVIPGTNRRALNEDIDILAHPGLLTEAEAKLAAKKGICVELTSRRGHSLTNGHVARVCLGAGAKLVLNSDAHEPEDLLTPELAEKVVLGAGLSRNEFRALEKHSTRLIKNF